MTTKATVEAYFEALRGKGAWDAFLSPDMVFTSYTSPPRLVSGRAAYLEATKRFYAAIAACEVRDLLVDGAKACALTRYALRPAAGDPFTSDVAEVFTVAADKIVTFAIYFDSAPFPK